MSSVTPAFGDNVRIRSTELTERLGLARCSGSVYGETKPSISDVEVIGEVINDFALNVMIDARGEQLWFAPELVEFIDYAPGTEIKIGDRRMIRDASGQWREPLDYESPVGRRSIWFHSRFVLLWTFAVIAIALVCLVIIITG